MEALWQKTPVCGNRFAAVLSFPPQLSVPMAVAILSSKNFPTGYKW
jgi:hypothetical protein